MTSITTSVLILGVGLLLISRHHRKVSEGLLRQAERNREVARQNLKDAQTNQQAAEATRHIADTIYGVESRLN